MKPVTDAIVRFFQKQHFTIVSTVGENKMPHSSCKGIIKIDKSGKIYLLDLYKQKTYANLKQNPLISITSVDEHKFEGWCLKGKAKMVAPKKLKTDIIKAWEKRLATRMTHRLLKNLTEKKGHGRHPEVQLPKPEYMIVMGVDEIVDLMPPHIK